MKISRFLSTFILYLVGGILFFSSFSFAEMLPIDASCWYCHSNYAPVTPSRSSTTPIIGGNHPVPSTCLDCHSSSIRGAQRMRMCNDCHFVPANSAAAGTYLVGRHRSPQGWYAFENLVNIRHDLPALHVSGEDFCLRCHVNTLTKEHNRVGRTDLYGEKITCNSCHTGAGHGSRLATGDVLKILKTAGSQNVTSGIFSAPLGETISRFRVSHALDSGNNMEVYAFYNNNWGLVYGRATGVEDNWIELPYQTTSLRTTLIATKAGTDGMWGIDVPEVELTPKTEDNPRYAMVRWAVLARDTGCEACHNLNEVRGHPDHAADNPAFCARCHDGSLIGEHDSCAACHESTNPIVEDAVDLKITNCSACHSDAWHEAAHDGTLDNHCSSCHKASIVREHMDNDTTNSKNYTCDTCHDSSARNVAWGFIGYKYRAVSCTGCHNTAHGLILCDSVPFDIPLDSRFSWSLPMEAYIFANETFAPAGYIDGKLIVSNRMNSVTTHEIWSFYSEQMAEQEWTLLSEEPQPGSTYIAADFNKDDRLLTIKAYNTVDASPGGRVVSSGYRVEIWYK